MKRLRPRLLALKMDEGDPKPRNAGSLEKLEKSREGIPPTEPPKRNAALPTP